MLCVVWGCAGCYLRSTRNRFRIAGSSVCNSLNKGLARLQCLYEDLDVDFKWAAPSLLVSLSLVPDFYSLLFRTYNIYYSLWTVPLYSDQICRRYWLWWVICLWLVCLFFFIIFFMFFSSAAFQPKKKTSSASLSLSYYLAAAPPFEHKHKSLSLPHRIRTIFYFYFHCGGRSGLFWLLLKNKKKKQIMGAKEDIWIDQHYFNKFSLFFLCAIFFLRGNFR